MKKSMKLYDNITYALSGILGFLFRVKVVGSQNQVFDGPVIMCANHMSNWDPVILACKTKRSVRFMAKSELFKIPVLKTILRAVGAFPIDRGTSDIAAIKMTLGVLRDGGDICLFPQGTRYSGKEPEGTEVKSGIGMLLNHSKAAILPVAIYSKNYKIRLFRRTFVIIGKPKTFEAYHFADNSREEYQRVSDEIFSDICTMVHDARDGKYGK